MTQDLQSGREAFQRGDWHEATKWLSSADAATPLAVDDLERLAVASYLAGMEEQSLETWARIHQACLDHGQAPRAVRAAFWMMLELLARAEWARASGWLARCQRLLDAERDCPECGLLLVLESRTALKQGDTATALAAASRAFELGERFADPDLRALGLLARGQALARQGTTPQAVTLLDEAMVTISIGGKSPIAVGTVYCAVIDFCRQIMDLGRMREWTEVLSKWSEGQPDRVPFRGKCLVHRAELLCFRGEWASALDEARRACGGPRPMGAAYYQIAEVHRARGDFPAAESAYREANEYGHAPGPGPALLRIAQGDTAGAATPIRRALVEPADLRGRSAALAAAVEIEIAAGNANAARRAAEELANLANEARIPWVAALSAQADGTLLLAEGDARGALGRLREAWMAWQDLEAPYEAARVRITMGLARRALGDEDAALLEFDAAHRVCERLGAAPELERIARLRHPTKRAAASGLTPREHEILLRIATGMTNRAIARELFISERTVDRHVSNILTKLDLPSRAAATAYAYEHHLV